MTAIATRLFVGNLPENTIENDLLTAFSTYGEIKTLDLKSKSATPEETKKFAFVTLSASNYNVEACIKHFSNEVFKGNRLYVTRARESFLERLQRERDQAQKKDQNKPDQDVHARHPVLKLSDKLNPGKRKLDTDHLIKEIHCKHDTNKSNNHNLPSSLPNDREHQKKYNVVTENDTKQLDSDKKRMDSMKKKRQEFKQKQMIIKTGLTIIDKVPNNKVIFSDSDEDTHQVYKHSKTQSRDTKKKNELFDEEESGDELNFEIKKQFEGKKGQKILDLQSKYKSDKRFTLDEKFMDDEQSEDESKEWADTDEAIELEQTDEKAKQLNILQNVLGVSIRPRISDHDNKKNKPKFGMLRFDPSQPEHAKFFAPVEEIKQDLSKKGKRKLKEKKQNDPMHEVEKVEASKEQFYKVSETLKEAIAQPSTFSLRSLFGNNEDPVNGVQQETNYIPLEKPKNPKVKNPLQPGEKNPFTYDSSDSETEDTKPEPKTDPSAVYTETKAVWKENLFFTKHDQRFIEALAYFNRANETEGQKERRELKSLMKKRIYNKERKNQMFQKKIGGRKKSIKKVFRKRVQ